MTRALATLVIIIGIIPAGCGKGDGATAAAVSRAQSNDAATAAEIRAVLDRYVKAVNDADDTLLRELWADAEHVSYVNPMQRLRSWGELQGFWQGFLKNSFTQRELKKRVGNPANRSGDVMVPGYDHRPMTGVPFTNSRG